MKTFLKLLFLAPAVQKHIIFLIVFLLKHHILFFFKIEFCNLKTKRAWWRRKFVKVVSCAIRSKKAYLLFASPRFHVSLGFF